MATWQHCAPSPAVSRGQLHQLRRQRLGGHYAKVAEAKQYPVVASIDQVVVNGDHAEANVTSYMAYDPAMTSIRSFDLQFRDDQWQICQAS